MEAILSLRSAIKILAFTVCLPLINSTSHAQPAAADAGSAVAKDAHVVIEKMSYHPSSITVDKGSKVTWTDEQGIIPHDVTSDIKGLFASGNMHKGDTFSYTFKEAGTFTYYCTHHKKMHGKVIVK